MSKATSDATFENDVLKSTKPVLVDFWAPWCGPCRMLIPVVDEISEEMAEKLEVFKCNVDENKSTPAKYSVRGIPSLMMFKNGELVGTKVGAVSKSALIDWINSLI